MTPGRTAREWELRAPSGKVLSPLPKHLIRATLRGRPITIYGDGRQVRDALFVEDLVDAFLLALGMRRIAGEAFNVGGGPERTLSLLELISMIEALEVERPVVEFGPWRAADQRWYVSDTRKLQRALGWCPIVGVAEGLLLRHRGGRGAVAWAEALARGARYDPAAEGLVTVAEALDGIYAAARDDDSVLR